MRAALLSLVLWRWRRSSWRGRGSAHQQLQAPVGVLLQVVQGAQQGGIHLGGQVLKGHHHATQRLAVLRGRSTPCQRVVWSGEERPGAAQHHPQDAQSAMSLRAGLHSQLRGRRLVDKMSMHAFFSRTRKRLVAGQ